MNREVSLFFNSANFIPVVPGRCEMPFCDHSLRPQLFLCSGSSAENVTLSDFHMLRCARTVPLRDVNLTLTTATSYWQVIQRSVGQIFIPLSSEAKDSKKRRHLALSFNIDTFIYWNYASWPVFTLKLTCSQTQNWIETNEEFKLFKI